MPVAAVVVEPTCNKTGLSASSNFLAQLYKVVNDGGAALVVDEINTGCGASGVGFWQYDGPADYVTFGKRMQLAGFFTSEDDDHIHLGGNMLALSRFNVIKSVMDSDGLIA